MIQIEKHIEILLLDNDCVIVPGLGGFMTHYAPARYDEEDNLFLPPQRTIGFNPQLTMNDSLLAQQYVEAYDISYPDALKRIENEVEELRQRLDSDGMYELHNIGTLSLGEEGQMVFDPCDAGVMTPWLYGLDAFPMEEMSSKEMVGKEPERGRTIVSHDTLTIPLSWVRNTVATMAAVVVFFLMLTPVANSQRDSQELMEQSSFFPFNMSNSGAAAVYSESNEVQAEPTETTPEQQAVSAEAEAAEAEAEAKPTAEQAQNAEQTPQADVAAETWTIVMASYVTKRGAGELVAHLSKQGLDAGRVYTYNNITRAIYGSYSSHDEAHAAMKQLRQQSNTFAEAWVMKIED